MTHDLPGSAPIDSLDDLLEAWEESPSWHAAVRETVSRLGYARRDVERQLVHVRRRCRADVLRQLAASELDGLAPGEVSWPSTVLVLAPGAVPGLAIEGIAAALATGAHVLVRPSGEETVLHHLISEASGWYGDLARRVEVVGTGSEPPWSRADGAIVFGTDETIALVRDRLPDGARVAGYGSRQAIAVATTGADIDPSWATRLADDVLTFRQRGCMSPTWLFVVGDAAATEPLCEAVGRELAAARERHASGSGEDRVSQRRASDADVLGAIAAGMAGDSRELFAGEARLTVVRVDSLAELPAAVGALGSLLQTAVIATGREERPRIAELLLDTGCTRMALPGEAHLPHELWPQDGIGRLRPLAR